MIHDVSKERIFFFILKDHENREEYSNRPFRKKTKSFIRNVWSHLPHYAASQRRVPKAPFVSIVIAVRVLVIRVKTFETVFCCLVSEDAAKEDSSKFSGN